MLKKLFGKNKEEKKDIPTPAPRNLSDKDRVQNQIFRNLAAPVAYEKGTTSDSFIEKIEKEEPMLNQDETGMHLFGAESQSVWNEDEEYEASIVNTDLKETIKFMKRKQCTDFIVLCKGNTEVVFTFKEMCKMAGYDPADFDSYEAPAMGGTSGGTRVIGGSAGIDRIAAAHEKKQNTEQQQSNEAETTEDKNEHIKTFLSSRKFLTFIDKNVKDVLIDSSSLKDVVVAAASEMELAMYAASSEKRNPFLRMEQHIGVAEVTIGTIIEAMKSNNAELIFFYGGGEGPDGKLVIPKMGRFSHAELVEYIETNRALDIQDNTKDEATLATVQDWAKQLSNTGFIAIPCAANPKNEIMYPPQLGFNIFQSNRTGLKYILISYVNKFPTHTSGEKPLEYVPLTPCTVNCICESLGLAGLVFSSGNKVYIMDVKELCEMAQYDDFKKGMSIYNFVDYKFTPEQRKEMFNIFAKLLTAMSTTSDGFNLFTEQGRRSAATIAYYIASWFATYPIEDATSWLTNFIDMFHKNESMFIEHIINHMRTHVGNDVSLSKSVVGYILALCDKYNNAPQYKMEMLALMEANDGPLWLREDFDGVCASIAMANLNELEKILTSRGQKRLFDDIRDTPFQCKNALIDEWVYAEHRGRLKVGCITQAYGVTAEAVMEHLKQNQVQVIYSTMFKYLTNPQSDDMLNLAKAALTIEEAIANVRGARRKDTHMTCAGVMTENMSKVQSMAPTKTWGERDTSAPATAAQPQPTPAVKSGGQDAVAAAMAALTRKTPAQPAPAVQQTTQPRPQQSNKPQYKVHAIRYKDGMELSDLFYTMLITGAASMASEDNYIGIIVLCGNQTIKYKYFNGHLVMKEEDFNKQYPGYEFNDDVNNYKSDILNQNNESSQSSQANINTPIKRDFSEREMMIAEKSIYVTMLTEHNMTQQACDKNIKAFKEHPDIMMEYGEYTLTKEFTNNPIVVEGYTAKKLTETTKLTVLGAYNYLIYLRRNPAEALKNLANGLPTK